MHRFTAFAVVGLEIESAVLPQKADNVGRRDASLDTECGLGQMRLTVC